MFTNIFIWNGGLNSFWRIYDNLLSYVRERLIYDSLLLNVQHWYRKHQVDESARSCGGSK
jgi:hypothetical protein